MPRATSAELFKDVPQINGAELLSRISGYYFGKAGVLVLGSAFFSSACITTTLGLISSASEYFEELTDGRQNMYGVAAWCLIGFGVANFGLTTIIKGSIPVLVAIYPVAIMLIILLSIR